PAGDPARADLGAPGPPLVAAPASPAHRSRLAPASFEGTDRAPCWVWIERRSVDEARRGGHAGAGLRRRLRSLGGAAALRGGGAAGAREGARGGDGPARLRGLW